MYSFILFLTGYFFTIGKIKVFLIKNHFFTPLFYPLAATRGFFMPGAGT